MYKIRQSLFVHLPPRTSNKSENGTESKLDKSSILNAGKVDLTLSNVLRDIKGRIKTHITKDIKKDDKPDSRLGITQEMGEMDDTSSTSNKSNNLSSITILKEVYDKIDKRLYSWGFKVGDTHIQIPSVSPKVDPLAFDLAETCKRCVVFANNHISENYSISIRGISLDNIKIRNFVDNVKYNKNKGCNILEYDNTLKNIKNKCEDTLAKIVHRTGSSEIKNKSTEFKQKCEAENEQQFVQYIDEWKRCYL